MNQLTFKIAAREASRVLVRTAIVGSAVWARVTKQTALTVIGGVSHSVDTPLGCAPSFVRDSVAKLAPGQDWKTDTLEYKHNDELVWSFDWDDRILRVYCSEG
jgi:hypothetical protein